MKTPVLVLFLLIASLARAAAPVDLGSGQAYVRVHGTADLRDLPPGALVLDLRYPAGGEDAARELRAWLAARPRTAELFVLVSPMTPPPVATVVAQSGAVTLGAPGSLPAPGVVVQTEPASDRRAYEAADAGTPIATLISGKVVKERYDEASLVADFNRGDHDAEPPAGPDPTAAKADKARETPLVDRVLQRAAGLHRALQALRP
ncbi:MAG TPA: hypothetical protein VHD61_01620 [Lacunisphaera sp.]|nr:hypothetical protein [Lacunisphaera sp.]